LGEGAEPVALGSVPGDPNADGLSEDGQGVKKVVEPFDRY
jgi:hypothetical protein